MDRFRACNYVVPVVERMGLIRKILNNEQSAAASMFDLFMNLPDDHLHEVMGILLQFCLPDRTIITSALELHVFPNADPPAHNQVGFLREPNRLWNDPRPASRESIWFYFLFRWTVMYFDSTTNILVKSVSVSFPGMQAEECQRLLLLSIATYHPHLLNLLVPYVRHILSSPDYLRDATEYSEVLLLTRYIFASNAITSQDTMPFLQLFEWGAGLNANVQSMALRTDALQTIAAVEVVALERWVRTCTSPILITCLCRILTELPSDIHYISVLAFSFADLFIDIDWDLSRPYLYERSIHVLLSVTNGSSALYSFVASHLFSRLSLAHPRINYIESCFYAFTQALQGVKTDAILKHRIEENLRAAVMTNGNRDCFIALVNINEDQANDWKSLFPGISWKGPNANVLIDTLTAQPMVRAWRFTASDSAIVSLETIVRHVSTNGFRNPFTNILFTWEDVVSS